MHWDMYARRRWHWRSSSLQKWDMSLFYLEDKCQCGVRCSIDCFQRNTHAVVLRRRDMFTWASFLPLFFQTCTGDKKNKPRTTIIYTTEREDKIVDCESCVNVREWCACVNMGDRLLSMFVWMRAVCVFRQIDGVAMGSPLGPALANIFVGFYERKIPADELPTMYNRYVDDVFSLFENKAKCTDFHQRLNTLHPALRFALEEEDNGSLPFLDVRVTKKGFRLCYISVLEAYVYWPLHPMGLFQPDTIQNQPCPLPDQQNSSHLLTISRSKRTRRPPHGSRKKQIPRSYTWQVGHPRPASKTCQTLAMSTNTASAVAWSENWATDQEGKRCRALGIPCWRGTCCIQHEPSVSLTEGRSTHPQAKQFDLLSSAGCARAGTWGRHSNGLASGLSNTYQGTS